MTPQKFTRLSGALEAAYKRSGLAPSRVMREVENLSGGYLGEGAVRVETGEAALAYALYFMPEHFLKPFWALCELLETVRVSPGKRMVVKDFGSGPGTAVWALCEALKDKGRGTIVRCALQDMSGPLLEIAKRISASYCGQLEPSFSSGDFTGSTVPPQNPDLVMFCNTLSEISGPADIMTSVVKRELSSLVDNGAVLVVEPATEKGIETITRLRKSFAENCIMPCPVPGSCPMLDKAGRACHFDIPAGVPSELQRVVTAGHRKSKFCVLALSRNPGGREIVGGHAEPGADERPRVFRMLSPFLKKPWGREAEACDGRNLSRLIIKKVPARESKKAVEAVQCGDLVHVTPERIKGNSVFLKEAPEVRHPSYRVGAADPSTCSTASRPGGV